MPVDIQRNITVGQVCTRQTLYDMIWTSRLTGVDYASLSADAKNACVWCASSPPVSMANGAWWWDMTTQLMRVFDSATSYAYAIGPDRFEIPARAAIPLWCGWGVKIDANLTFAQNGNNLGIPTVTPCGGAPLDWCNCMGIASESADSGAYVPVTVEGFVPAYFGALYKWNSIGISGFNNPTPPNIVVGATGYTGVCGALSTVNTGMSLHTVIGYLMEKTEAETRCSMCLYIKFIGPRWMGRGKTAT